MWNGGKIVDCRMRWWCNLRSILDCTPWNEIETRRRIDGNGGTQEKDRIHPEVERMICICLELDCVVLRRVVFVRGILVRVVFVFGAVLGSSSWFECQCHGR